jgi:hypothetical protein
MGRLRNLAQTVHEFATNHVEEPDIPAVADGDDGYAESTKVALLYPRRRSTNCSGNSKIMSTRCPASLMSLT